MKAVSILFLSIILSVNLNAQFIKNYGIKFGVATTGQYTRIHIPEDNMDPVPMFQPNTNYLGWTVGLNAEFMDYPPFSMLFEGNYIQKGFQEEWSEDVAGVNTTHIYKMRFDYLSFSLLAKASMVLGAFSPYILLGPRIDIAIANENSFYDSYNNKYIPGFAAGIGSEITLFKTKFLAEVTYDFNFGKLHEDTYETISYESYVFRVGIIL